MVRIEGKRVLPVRVARVSGGGRARGKGGEVFARSLGDLQAEAGEGGGVSEPSPLAAEQLLSIQEAGASKGDRWQERKRGISYGEGLLHRLEGLHVRLLSGGVAMEDLRQLSEFFADKRVVPGEARLRGILAEIELRVEVEIAKRSRTQNLQ